MNQFANGDALLSNAYFCNVLFRWFGGFVVADLTEQRMCTKLCFKVNKTAAKTQKLLQEAFGNNGMSQSRIFSGTSVSRKEKRLLKTMTVLDDCP